MLIGSHIIIQSTNADADRAFIRDVLGLSGIDSGGGWLIFGLPPSEVAVHPSDKNDRHDFYLICEDVAAFVAKMAASGVEHTPVEDQGWGRITNITLPGGGKLGVYQAQHARPEAPKAARAAKPARARAKGRVRPKAKVQAKAKVKAKAKVRVKAKAKAKARAKAGAKAKRRPKKA
jgi:hypothetical protein